ncbi:LexA family protein [Pseudomonas multiresinivorans]|nr:S24 family peptidase [Pseudomonas multiresinivorans]
MELKDRIKGRLRDMKLTQSELATRVGVSKGTVTFWLNGTNMIKGENLMAVARELQCSPEWLLSGKGQPGEPGSHSNVRPARTPYREAKGYPLISWIIAGEWAESCDNFQPGDAEEWFTSEANAGPKGYWLEVEGDSMIAPPGSGYSFTPGTLILVRPEGFDLVSGKLYVAKMLDTDETTFKVYIRDFGASYLKPLNPAFRTLEINDNVQIIGRVVDARPPRSVF